MSRENRTRSLTLLDGDRRVRDRETDIGAELFGFRETADEGIQEPIEEERPGEIDKNTIPITEEKGEEAAEAVRKEENTYSRTVGWQKPSASDTAGDAGGAVTQPEMIKEEAPVVPKEEVATGFYKKDTPGERPTKETSQPITPEPCLAAPRTEARSYPPPVERPVMEEAGTGRGNQPEYRYRYPKLEQPEPEFKSFRHLMINVYSPKGGVGKSSISKELAVAFSMASVERSPLKVLIVDADWEFGDVSTLFNVAPRPCVTDWVKDMLMDKRQTGHIHLYSRQEIAARYLIPYTDNLHILAGPGDPAEAELITEEVVTAIIESLKRTDYDIIIFDSANSNRARSLIPLMKADAVVLVETLDTSTVAETTTVLNTLRTQQFDFGKLYMVLNQVPDDDMRMDISVSEISRLLQLDIAAVIPRYEMLRMINNAGEAAVLKKNTPYSRAIFQLANRIVPVFKQEKKSALSSLFGLFSKKR